MGWKGSEKQATWAEILEFIIENGRVEGDTPDERMESAIVEFDFEMAERGLSADWEACSAWVREHFDPM